jgi:hypothetical protein
MEPRKTIFPPIDSFFSIYIQLFNDQFVSTLKSRSIDPGPIVSSSALASNFLALRDYSFHYAHLLFHQLLLFLTNPLSKFMVSLRIFAHGR